MAPPGIPEPAIPNGNNGRHPDSNTSTPISTSPESTRSSKSTTSGKASTSGASRHLYIGNGHRSESTGGDIARRASGTESEVLSTQANGAQKDRAKKLPRSKTEIDLITRGPRESREDEPGQEWEVRHGWGQQYYSKEVFTILNKVAYPYNSYFTYYTNKGHETDGRPTVSMHTPPPKDWNQKDKTKTVQGSLVLCLNLGVDPPDVIRPNPSATMECWIDPTKSTQQNPKILEQIGKALQGQYENLSIKTRYRQHLDPSLDETKRFTTAARRNAKEERVLFHYNGHGVPLPTPSGEIWVFNRDYTQYIPVALYDLQSWLGGPSLCIYDCSHAGNVIGNYERYVQKHEDENQELRMTRPDVAIQNYGGNLHLAACGKSETLPTDPELPADLFTCCLSTPIEISLLFHTLQNPIHRNITAEDLKQVPGKAQERRSPMGELNWILTAITDTIAWNCLPTDLFRKLFRQDLMVAALFRNFIVAERIMTAYGCHPTTHPKIPPTHDHPLWEAWDLAVELVVSQLPDLIASRQEGAQPYEYQQSNFFSEQLQAFEHYLEQGAPRKDPPTQLPIVLQVLLSQVHRFRALMLLSKFVDQGPWAVNYALTIGIFPYVVKLLQSPAVELKPIMIFIWTRIMAVAAKDSFYVHSELLRDNNFSYFISVLVSGSVLPLGHGEFHHASHRAMCAFVMTMFCRGFGQAQQVCLSSRPSLMDCCLNFLQAGDGDAGSTLLRQWACLCISELWKNYPEAKWVGIRSLAHHRLCALIVDPVPDVRAAAIHALTNFLGIPDLTEAVAQNEKMVASTLMIMTTDANITVRRELLVFYSAFVRRYRNKFMVAAFETLTEELEHLLEVSAGVENDRQPKVNGTLAAGSHHSSDSKVSEDTLQGAMWYQLITLSVDPHPDVAQTAGMIVDYIHNALLDSPLGSHTQESIDKILDLTSQRPLPGSRAPSAAPSARPESSPAPRGQAELKPEGYISLGFKRTASVAAALAKLVAGGPSMDNLAATNGNVPIPVQQKRLSGPGRAGIPTEWSTPPDQRDSPHTSGKYIKAKTPRPKQFQERQGREVVELPLRSDFLDYSLEYFLEPQMKPYEPDEPGSDDYNQRLWRRERNDKILAKTQPLKSFASTNPWDKDAGFFNNGSQPSKMAFHQFEDHLVVADDRDSICIWNWRDRTRLSRFSVGNPKGSKINEARFINEDDQALLIVGSSDGVVKIFRNYDRDPELVTAYRALNEMVPSTRNAGLVFEWQQSQGKLLVAGDAKVIRVWNAQTELCIKDIPARSGSCITSLTSDQVVGEVFAAGYGDGAVRVFDQRLKPALAQVKVWREQKQWITNVHMQRGGQRELVSGSRNGEVKLWDVRMEKSIQTVRAPGVLRTLSVHEHAPVFATGSDHHALTLFNMNGGLLNTLHPYSPFLSAARSSPITTTAFHPHQMLLSAGCVGSTWINIYTCGEGKVAI
ncbi:uncharacterized protein KY384_001198 [Bacidia gigantensis]|uniref:uncharacterized protein n=1 Tax=Bacidia gigantensis TaxID=2732470 RepID=UPI001D03EB2D|nr:uncharacterized protein KY384_001198 [Bacidia gigantensis]KAG8534354.1 hypothetical protein KY384_001198 [Bacidia gigantensis]